ncbi:MAG: hypothetical protein EPN20_02470, partial [Magnetospirillum sp.]
MVVPILGGEDKHHHSAPPLAVLRPDPPPVEPRPAIPSDGRTTRLGGIALSVLWIALCAYYANTSIGWGNLVFMQPQEIGGIAGAAFMPLAFLWLVVAYLDRGQELRSVSVEIRQQLSRLTYPAEGAEARVSAIADSLRAQARELVQASNDASTKGEAIRDMLAKQVEAMTTVVGRVVGGLHQLA